MNARYLLPIPLLALLTTFVAGFAPAPVYKEPEKPVAPPILEAMQGTWTQSTRTKSKRMMRVSIQGKTWTKLSSIPRGADSTAFTYEIFLDTNRSPVALDLRRNPTSQSTMKGIVKLEGDRLTFCYTNTNNEDERPKAFTDRETSRGRVVRTMTLTRIE